MISAFTPLSNPDKYNYCWREAIRSFMPAVDEMVVVYNTYSTDGSREAVEALQKELGFRLVTSVFDLRKYGWASYGIIRTTGYQACNGDIILMFDADGVLHENDVGQTRALAEEMSKRTDVVYGYWQKYRIFAKDAYWNQFKHSGWYNKKAMGDAFDFYRDDGKGAPNTTRIGEELQRAREFPIKLYGYEHTLDTKESMMERVTSYGHMMHDVYGGDLKTPEEYLDAYLQDFKESFDKKGVRGELNHPAVMNDYLSKITPDHFGHNMFGVTDA